MKKISLILLCFSTFSVGYSAEKKLVIMGGGGEPAGSTTIFDGKLGLVSNFTNSKNSKWNVSHNFNGGHATTESILSTRFQNSKDLGDFTEVNFKKNIAELVRQIEVGELKAGDQLMVFIDSHGAVNRGNEKSHSIAMSYGAATELTNLSGAKVSSVDSLEELVKIANNNGIKLALLDFSCFSGNTLKLASANTCVISGSGEKQYSYAEIRKADDTSKASTFGAKFFQNMKAGKNLEELFIDAREDTISADFPMISTETGKLVNELIYNMISPYLVYNDNHSTDFQKSYDPKNAALALCKTGEQYDEIVKRLDEIAVMANLPKRLIDTKKLKKTLEKYREYQMKYEQDWMQTQNVGTEVKEIIARDYKDQAKLFEREDGLSIIQVDRQKTIDMYKKMLDEADTDFSKKFHQRIYDEVLLKDKISKEIKAKLSQSSNDRLEKFDETFKNSFKTKELANDVSEEAKKLYDKLYRTLEKEDKTSNPCKDFII
jgi:hypothetical protein